MMYPINISNLAKKPVIEIEEGFSLIEVTIAMVTLGICLAYAMPLFLYAKLNNARSEVRTGALIVAQRVFDNVRSQPFGALPSSDGAVSNLTGCTYPTAVPTNLLGCKNNAANPNPVITPNVPNIGLKSGEAGYVAISPKDKLLTSAIGRQYQTKVTYCEGLTGDATVCSSKYRTFKVEVSFNGSPVYNVQGTYTDFQ